MKKTKGFSLLELLISVAISSIIFIVVVTVVNLSLSKSKGGFESFQAQDEALGIMNKMGKEIRQANVLLDAQDQTITFRRFLQVSDAAPAQIRYFISGQTLSRGEILPTGTPPAYTYDPLAETTEPESFSIANGANPIFTYFDENGTQLIAPITLGAVTLIDISLSFEQEGNISPLEVETKVQLRFNKNNL